MIDERVVDDLLLALPGRGRERSALDPRRHVRRGLLLEEVLPLPAVGIALHRERPIAKMRDEHFGDVLVVRDEIALGDPLLRPEGLVQVREPELAAALLQNRRQRGLLLAHLGGRLVLPQSEVDRGAQTSLVRPFGKRHLRHEQRLHPDDVRTANARHLRRLGKGRVGARERLQQPEQSRDLGLVESRTDVSGPAEPADIVYSGDEGAETRRAPALPLRVARNHDLLVLPHLHLVPIGAASSGLVARVEAFRDHAFQLLLFGRREQRRPVVELGRENDAAPRGVDQRLQPLPALRQRKPDERLRVELEQVEDDEDQRAGALLEEREPGTAAVVERADLGVEHRIRRTRPKLCRSRRRLEARGQVVAVPAGKRRLTARDRDERAEAVPLGLVDPAFAAGEHLGRGREHGRVPDRALHGAVLAQEEPVLRISVEVRGHERPDAVQPLSQQADRRDRRHASPRPARTCRDPRSRRSRRRTRRPGSCPSKSPYSSG